MSTNESATAGSSYIRLFQNAVNRIQAKWGSNQNLIGATFYRALLTEEIYTILAAQDDSVPAENIARMMRDGYIFIDEHCTRKFS